MSGLNWESTVTYQNKYLNHKPSPKNTYTICAYFAGFTKEEVVKHLENEKKGRLQRLITYTEPVERIKP